MGWQKQWLQADGQSMGRGDRLGSSCVQPSVEDNDAAGAAAVRDAYRGETQDRGLNMDTIT